MNQPAEHPPGATPYGESPYGATPYGESPYGGTPYAGIRVPNNIGWAIAALLLFWPLAIPAFIAAGRVDDLAGHGDLAGAQYQAEQARKWGRTALWVAVGFWTLMIVLVCVGFLLTLVTALGAGAAAAPAS